jgi:GTP:adenosylcobinamide-phosphate guanylyltransferase
LVLAGSRSDPAAGQSATKAGLSLRGLPMIRRVVDALRQSTAVKRVVVAGPQHLSAWIDAEIVATAGSPASTVAAFLESQTEPWPVLVTTADHPLLTAEMVDHFCRESRRTGADATVGMASRSTIASAYPATRRTFYPFRDDGWCGCNIFGFNTAGSRDVARTWTSFERYRKRPLSVIGKFGLLNLIGVLLRRWTLEQAFARAADRLGVTARPVPMPWAEAAIDVDTMEDLVLVDSILARQERIAAGE